MIQTNLWIFRVLRWFECFRGLRNSSMTFASLGIKRELGIEVRGLEAFVIRKNHLALNDRLGLFCLGFLYFHPLRVRQDGGSFEMFARRRHVYGRQRLLEQGFSPLHIHSSHHLEHQDDRSCVACVLRTLSLLLLDRPRSNDARHALSSSDLVAR